MYLLQDAEMEEKKKKEEEEKLRISKLEAAQHECEVEHVERFYTELSHKERNTTSPLLLDSVVTPTVEPSCSCTNIIVAAQCKQLLQSARQERDNALLLARQYGDIAEECQTEKRRLKHKLEERVELVRNFWRNKVEGGSRTMHSHYYTFVACIHCVYLLLIVVNFGSKLLSMQGAQNLTAKGTYGAHPGH